MRWIALASFAGLALASSAQSQVVTTVTTSPTGTTTQVQTTSATDAVTAKALADAEKAKLDAANAQFSSTGISGAVQTGAGAGTEEANLLVAVAMKAAARHVTTAVKDSRVLVIIGTTAPDLSAWATFDARQDGIDKALDRDSRALDAALAALPRPKPPGADRALELKDVLPIGAALADIPKILSYFATDYSASGLSVPPDDYMFEAALAHYATGWTIYTHLLTISDGSQVLAQIRSLTDKAAREAAHVARANVAIDGLDDKSAPVKRVKAAIVDLQSDIALYNAFITSLSTGGAQSLGAILQAKVASDYLNQPPGGVMFIKVHASSGGLITKKSVWNMLGAMPLYASGGVVVSYVYYSRAVKDGPLTRTADLFGEMTPYHTVGHVKTAVALDREGSCDRPAGSDAKKYCAWQADK